MLIELYGRGIVRPDFTFEVTISDDIITDDSNDISSLKVYGGKYGDEVEQKN